MVLSIIIPMYKVEAYIEKCLNSCLKQDITINEYEIICINDGSPDSSLHIAEKVAEKNVNIKVFSQPNRGLSAARNTGIEKARGDYLFFVDSDDWIQENCLRKLVNQLNSERPDVLAICAANVVGDNPIRRFSYKGISCMVGPESMKYVSCSCAPFLIVRREFLNLNNVRFCEGIYHEDSEYTPRMLFLAKKVSFTDDIIYYVFQNPGSITRTINPKKVEDVITVVAPHLFIFSKSITERQYKRRFCYLICSSINTALARNLTGNKSEVEYYNYLFYQNRQLVKAFINSLTFRYIIEGSLLFLFPKYLVQVYILLNLPSSRKFFHGKHMS